MDIEETIANYIGRNQFWLSHRNGLNPIILKSIEAEVRTYRTAPRDIHKLKMEIALKTKEFNNCRKFPERDILQTELETLKEMRDIINSALYGRLES